MVKGELITQTTQAGTPGERRDMLERTMPDRLREISEKWYELHQQYRKTEITLFWQLAKDVKLVSGAPDTYGSDAVKRLLERHEYDPSMFSKLLAVANNLSEEFVQKVLEYNASQKSKFGLVSSSHLQVLAAAESTKHRNKLWERITKAKLSVRDACAEADATSTAPPKDLDEAAAKRITATLGRSEKVISQAIEVGTVICSETFIESLERVKPQDLGKAISKCQAARTNLEQLCAQTEEMLTVYEQVHERLKHRFDQEMAKAAAKGKEVTERGSKSRRKALANKAMQAAIAEGEEADDLTAEDTATVIDVKPVAGIAAAKQKPAKPAKPASAPQPVRKKVPAGSVAADKVVLKKPTIVPSNSKVQFRRPTPKKS